MKIAVPTMNGKVNPHFGQTSEFTVFTVDDQSGEILAESSFESTPHSGQSQGQGHGMGMGPGGGGGGGCHSRAFNLLTEAGVDVLIAGGMGAGAVNALQRCGIKACRGAKGNARKAVEAYAQGLLTDSGEVCQDHHKQN